MVELWKIHRLDDLKADDEQLWGWADHYSQQILSSHKEELAACMKRRDERVKPDDSSTDTLLVSIVRSRNDTCRRIRAKLP